MKHKVLKQVMSLLLVAVLTVGLLFAMTFPVSAEVAEAAETEDIYGEDPNYEHGYFLGGRGYWEGGTWIREVYDWDDMDQVFEKLDSSSMFNYGYVTIKLMADLSMTAQGLANDAYTMKEYSIDYGLNNVVFDFNGHTLSATDDVSTTNLEYPLESFIRLYVGGGNVLTFTDSVGGGGINFYSSRAIDSGLAALHVYSAGARGTYDEEDLNSYPAKVVFNGGTYEMTAKIEKFGSGTCYDEFLFRGTVIADYVDVEINDGTFIANSEGLISSYENRDMCARELAAFGTVISDWQNFPDESNPKYGEVIPYEETGRTVINGGKFISDGYAVHHFDNCNLYQFNGLTDSRVQTLDSHFHVNYPTINGGYFSGQMGFTGLTFTYSDGNEDLNSRPASEIIPETSLFIGVDGDGHKSTDITDWDWDDLHDMQQCLVVSEEAFEFKTTPEGTGDPIELTRTVKQSDTFGISWTIPSYLEGEVVCQPSFTVTRLNSSIEPSTYTRSNLTLDYSNYPRDVNVTCKLYVIAAGEAITFQQDYTVDVKRVYTATDVCMCCFVGGEEGWSEIVEGEDCSFEIYPNEYYELTDPDKFEVYVNDVLVTPDANGVYTVQNVTEDLQISCDGSAFTSYSNLTITANGKTVTEKIFDGGTYTFKTLAEFGVAVPEGSTFTGWKIGNKTYQPGETYTVPGGTEITVNAVFTGFYNITVEGGTAYADEAHTQPITFAAEGTKVYIVADETSEGKVFSIWSWTEESAGHYSWSSIEDSNSPSTWFTVSTCDITFTPVYETLVNEIVINGMIKPTAGVAVNNSDYSYKWGCSVPTNSGYSLGICYWYDTTTGEPVSMSDGDVFQVGHTYRFQAKISLYTDYIFPANAEDISVRLDGIDAKDYEWTINEFSYVYERAVIYFEFTCEEVIPAGTITDTGRTLNLDGIIYINQYITVEGYGGIDVAKNGGLMIWTSAVTEEEAIYANAEIIKARMVEVNGEYRQTTQGLAAAQYADKLYLRVYLQLEDGSYVYGPLKEYCVRDYCETIITKNAGKESALRDTCVALLHFGAAAQTYFGYNTDDLANKNIVADYPVEEWNADLLTSPDTFTTDIVATGDVTDNGKTMALNEAIQINYYFGVTGFEVESGELLVWDGVTDTLTEENATYTVELDAAGNEYKALSKVFAAAEYGKTIFACAKFVDTDGNVHYSDVVAYSPETYAEGRINKSSNANLVEAMKRMVTYGEYARVYFSETE